MKTISHTNRSKDKLLHIETDLGIVNIRVGLYDLKGRRVDSIEVIPSSYAGEHKIKRIGYCNTRLIELNKLN
jgi:hypothetical protein